MWGTCVEFSVGYGANEFVDYDSTPIPTSWGVNLVVAGAQVSLPTKQADIVKFPSQSKVN